MELRSSGLLCGGMEVCVQMGAFNYNQWGLFARQSEGIIERYTDHEQPTDV